MDELARKMEKARFFVEPQWDAARVESSLIHLHGRVRRRRAARVAAVTLVPVAVVLTLVLALGWWEETSLTENTQTIASTMPPVARPGPMLFQNATTVYFEDGSRATALNPESQLVARSVSSTNIRVLLQDGAARFEVTSRPERLFQVDAGDISVLVLGTAFTVTRQGEQTEVAVERGRVRVAWRDGAQVITAGQRGAYPPPPEQTTAPELGVPDGGAPRVIPPRDGPGQGRPSWQELANQARYAEAYEALRRAGGVASVRGMADALLAADVARRSGHSPEAVKLLERSITRHPSDPQTSIASFTLGRVLLRSRPRDAAQAFARARRLSPGGTLAEDALAREVEAWSRANATVQARQRAQEYLRRYPEGRRIGSVRLFGGLD